MKCKDTNNTVGRTGVTNRVVSSSLEFGKDAVSLTTYVCLPHLPPCPPPTPTRTMDPAEEKSLPLIRRRIPKIDQGSSRIEVFEDRLALSANPGVDLLLDALGMLQPESCVAEPLASPKPAFGELDAQTNDGGMQITSDFQLSNSAGSNSNLLSQAVDVRRDFGLSGSGQTIAVIDSGIAWDHVALGKGFGPGYRVVGGWDFAENDANPYDDAPGGFHGTHVAGIMGGNSNSLEGIAPGADLVGLRVFDDFGRRLDHGLKLEITQAEDQCGVGHNRIGWSNSEIS